jgi:hypothetical protein
MCMVHTAAHTPSRPFRGHWGEGRGGGVGLPGVWTLTWSLEQTQYAKQILSIIRTVSVHICYIKNSMGSIIYRFNNAVLSLCWYLKYYDVNSTRGAAASTHLLYKFSFLWPFFKSIGNQELLPLNIRLNSSTTVPVLHGDLRHYTIIIK